MLFYAYLYDRIDAEFDEWFWEMQEDADAECAECFDCDPACRLAA